MTRKYKVPLSEQYGKERDAFYPRIIRLTDKEVDYFDPDVEDE